MKVDFNQIKTTISLPDFLLELGWKIVEGSSNSCPKMSNGTHTIVIKRNSQNQYTYWDVHSDSVRGRSIMDLMQEHLFETTGKMPSLREVGEILQNYINTNRITTPEKSRYEVGNTSMRADELQFYLSQLQPYKGNYLQKRGILKESIESRFFKDTFFIREVKNKGSVYRNVCIKMYNENGVQAISQRNETFKGIIGGKFDCLATSNHDKSRPIDILYIGESFIDCISHYQLRHYKSDLNLVYVSTEGTFTEGQMRLLRLILDKNQIKELRSIFDNDKQGHKYGAVSFLQILSPELSDEMLADFLNTENGIVVNLHVQAIDQSDAIKTVKRKITDLDAMKIQEQKRAVRSGYDMDILPSDLATYGQDAKELLKTLQSRNERMFQLTFLVLNTADTRQKLENDVFWAAGIAQKYNCSLVRLDYQQEQGLMSSLPLGASHIQIERSLTTSSVAVFVPFVTQELFQGGDAMYYGINAKTGNMIMLDRKRARCPNGLKLGTPGSGKSMSCKSEIVSVFLCTPDDVYICDPEAEYYPLVKRLHGQVVKLSPTSKNYVNPLDINLNYSEDENPLALKSDFVLSFCELVMGGKNGLEAIEKTVIDRAVQVIYRPYLADPKPENMPILADLHKALLDQHTPEADRVAQALDLYVSGSLNVFNHRTNIDIKNRIVAFDIKELGKQLKKIGMLIVQDQIWGRVTQNRSKGKATWYFCDEFHLLLREEQTAAFSCEIWKRFRKWGGIPTGATQNVKDLLSSPEIENILENSDFICLLNQASGDRKILAERLNISPQQLRYVDNSEPGEGLLIYENVILPFKNPIPKNTQLYQIMTTRLGEGATV